ncbi:MAG: hypothetical protein WBV82_18500, partial [Myxococcaceae bacterium]
MARIPVHAPLRIAAALIALLAVSTAGAQTRHPASSKAQRIDELLNEWDVPGARAELEKLEQLMPEGAEPLRYFDGRVAFEEGRYEEATRLLTEAGIADKEHSYLRLAKDTLEITKEHQKLESEHFVFYFPPGKDEILAPYALDALEKIRKAMAEDLGYAPPGKVRVEVVNDARELSRVSTLTYEQIRTTGTIAICKFNKLMVTSPKAV